MTQEFSVGIVGAGLVGALQACLMAQRGFKVTLFEARHDGRHEINYYGRSLNLAISLRGILALKRLNLDHLVQDRAIPMKGRMIHNVDGSLKAIPYDPDGRTIDSIERAELNNFLLDKAEQLYKIDIKFNHKLVDLDADKGELVFRLYEDAEDGSRKLSDHLTSYKFDLICGCDGSRSSVRSLLARHSQLELEQTFIDHGYMELRVDPDENGGFQMAPNFLHIWPRGKYMMIALPNKDFSFTCNVFLPFDIINTFKEPEDGLNFFKKNFPDSVRFIGAERVRDVLSKARPSSLISIKCKPYCYKDKVVLLGDSAHAMVPFYGQGMNMGFEDSLVLDEILDKYLEKGANPDSETMSKVLMEYSDRRWPNGQSMCDLSMYNYIEMRDLVNKGSFIMRKRLDNLLYRIFPSKWIPLYSMVTFTRIPVNECVERRSKQDKILLMLERVSLIPVLLLASHILVTKFLLKR